MFSFKPKEKYPGQYEHIAFIAALAGKGVNGLLEIIGGVILIFINPAFARGLIFKLTQFELTEDPADLVANYLVKAAERFSVSAQVFGAVFLLSHGIIKIVLLVALFKKKLWAYPLASAVFSLFVVYQSYRFYLYRSPELILLNIIDIIIIVLTCFEYRRLRRGARKKENN
ncbi:MAG: DUF2127 domain-containing protein [Patescibacteria group bacterium]|jgi:uncharacterized membrane protein